MSGPIMFRDANPNAVALVLRDGGVFYTDGKPCTNPDHLAILPQSILDAQHRARQSDFAMRHGQRPPETTAAVSATDPPAACEVCGKVYTSKITPGRHRHAHKPVRA